VKAEVSSCTTTLPSSSLSSEKFSSRPRRMLDRSGCVISPGRILFLLGLLALEEALVPRATGQAVVTVYPAGKSRKLCLFHPMSGRYL
jgi:hypothetical protein